MAPGLHTPNKTSQKTTVPSVASQLKSRPFASASDREDYTSQPNSASSLSHHLSNVSVLPPASASSQAIQLMPNPNLTAGAGDELKQKLLASQQRIATQEAAEKAANTKQASARNWGKVKNQVRGEKYGMDLNTRYNLAPLADSKKPQDIVANARDQDLIIDKGAEAQKLQSEGKLAPDPMAGLIHHHHKTTKQLDAAQSNFDLKAKIAQEQDPQKKEELQHQHFAQRFKQGMPSTKVTKIITPDDANTFLKGEKLIDSRTNTAKDPSIGGFYAPGKASQGLSAAQSVHQFGLGYGWEKQADGKWAKKGNASPYLEQDPSKNPKTESGLKAVNKVHYIKSDLTPDLLNKTKIPMYSKMQKAIEQRANPAVGNQDPRAKEDAQKAADVLNRTTEYDRGEKPFTGTGSSNYGAELEAKKPQDRVNVNLITELTAVRSAALQSGTLHERTEAGKDKEVARLDPATKTFLKPGTGGKK